MGPVWMDLGCRTRVPDVETGFLWCAHSQTFWTSQVDNSACWRKRMCNRWHFQPVHWFHNSQTGRLLLSKMLKCQTNQHHAQLETLGRCGDYISMTSLPWGSQSYGPNTLEPEERWVRLNVHSALWAAGMMGRYPLFVQPRCRTLRCQEERSECTLRFTPLWDRPWESDSKTAGHLSSNHHHWIVWGPSTRVQGSPGDRHCSYRNTNNPGRCVNHRWESMEISRHSSNLWVEDIHADGTLQ